jgi:hypothetical protein
MKGPFQPTIFQVIKITNPKVTTYLSTTLHTLFLYLLQERFQRNRRAIVFMPTPSYKQGEVAHAILQHMRCGPSANTKEFVSALPFCTCSQCAHSKLAFTKYWTPKNNQTPPPQNTKLQPGG